MVIPPIDPDYLTETLVRLLNTPSPAGYTDQVVHLVGEELDRLGIPFEITRRGAIRADLRGRIASPDRAVVAHLDTLGAQVKFLKDNGRLALTSIGTWSSRFAEGARVSIFTDRAAFRGTILPLKASGHTYDTEVDTQPVSWDNIEVRIDEHVQNRDDLIRRGFNVGDFVSIDPCVEITGNGFINSRHLDDKAGVAAVLTAAKAIVESDAEIPVDCHLLFTISEEVGSGASAVLHGDVAEMVTVDNGTVAPGQCSREFGVTIAMADMVGPFDFHLTRRMLALCEKNNIAHQRDMFRYYRSDSASALEAGNDIRTALVCFGLDASHGWERTHRHSIESVASLLCAYIASDPVFERDRKVLGSISDFPTQPVRPEDFGDD